jgi:predicted permease
MNPLYSALLSFALPLLAGYVARRVMEAADRSPEPLLAFSRYQKYAANLVIGPVSSVLSLWTLNVSQIRLAALPAIGVAYIALGCLVAWIAARLMNMPGRQRGIFMFAGMNSNLGNIGGLLCYLFYGEAAYGLSNFFRILENPLYYLVGFPTASAMGNGQRITARSAVRQVLTDPSLLLPILGIAGGVALSWSGVTRPATLGTLNAVLIPLASINLAFAVGVTLRVGAVREHLRPCGAMAALKFAMLPALVWGLGRLAGLNTVDGGLPFRVAVLLSFMPVGFNSTMAATIFDLDEDLANALWLSSTVLLLPVLPLVKPLLG